MKRVHRTVRISMVLIALVTINFKLIAQVSSFYVYFVQNDKRINITDEKIELKKEPFRIYIEYTKPVDIIVNASSNGDTYKSALKGRLLYQIPGLNTNGEKQPFFQNKNTVVLNDEIPFLWYKNSTHGEKEMKNSDGRYVCYRNIDRFYIMDENRICNVNDIDKDVCFVFVYAEKNKSGDLEEIQREMVKIKWVKFYENETKSYARKKKVTGKEKIRLAKQDLKRKQKMEKKEENALERLEKQKEKALERKEKKQDKRDAKEKKRLEEDKQ